MQFQIIPASNGSAGEAKVTPKPDGSVMFQPSVLKGANIVRAVTVVAKGTGGMESKAVVLFNGSTGQFTIQDVTDGDQCTLVFDLPAHEFRARKDRTAKRKQRSRPAVTPAVNPTPVAPVQPAVT